MENFVKENFKPQLDQKLVFIYTKKKSKIKMQFPLYTIKYNTICFISYSAFQILNEAIFIFDFVNDF